MWKILATMILAASLGACAAQQETQIASLDLQPVSKATEARCAAIASTGDAYRYCVERAERSPSAQPDEILQALQADR
ncbi:MAG: hypothetical protein JSR24_11075 [Proteobacteria bacterium]|nr:hypothetical protein [Pseudomonadota bacterium]